MSTVFRGNAALVWTDPADAMTQRVLLLREPLRELRTGVKRTVYAADSMDYTARQTFTIGSLGAYELTARLRWNDNPQTLMELITAGAAQQTILYYPNLADGGTVYACYLISPLTPDVLKLDPMTGVIFGEQDVELVLRRTDGSAFQTVWRAGVLFRWRAGDRLQEATFTRNSKAWYSGSVGYGQLSTASTVAARLHWMSSASSLGPRTIPTLLLETTRTNVVLQNTNLKATSVWTAATVTVTSGQADPAGGTKAFKILDASTSLGVLVQVFTLTASTRRVVSCFLKAATGSWGQLLLQSSGGLTTYVQLLMTWSSGLPTVTANKGSVVGPVERWGNGFYRVAGLSSGTLSTGRYRITLIPTSGPAAAKGSIIAYAPQVE